MAMPAVLEDTRSLDSFRNIHLGQRCFVVGNGPSLAKLDLTRLGGELMFTANRGYLAARHGLPRGTYHVVSDPLTYQPYVEEFRAADVGLRFYREDVASLPEYRDNPDREPAIVFPFHRSPTMDEGFFAEDIAAGAYRGFSVLLDAIQLAYTMGFATVCVIGCDLDYTQPDTHVYGTGPMEQARRNVMPIPRVKQAMRVAADFLARRGRVLVNAGSGGHLDSIPRVDYAAILDRPHA